MINFIFDSSTRKRQIIQHLADIIDSEKYQVKYVNAHEPSSGLCIGVMGHALFEFVLEKVREYKEGTIEIKSLS